MTAFARAFGIGLLLAATATAADERTPALAKVLDDLARTAPADARDQLVAAIDASPPLAARLDALAGRGALTSITVAPRPRGSPFDARVIGSTIALSPTLLAALAKARIVDVARDDDVLPNNTAFVLAHLVHHLEAPPPSAVGSTLAAWVDRRLDDEAAALIDAWNVTLDEATRRHGGPLAPAQVGTLALNLRYRYAFVGESSPTPDPTTGSIADDAANRHAVADVLRNARLADVE